MRSARVEYRCDSVIGIRPGRSHASREELQTKIPFKLLRYDLSLVLKLLMRIRIIAHNTPMYIIAAFSNNQSSTIYCKLIM